MKSITYIKIFFAAFLLSSCKNDPELPPISMEGKNTFGCKVNGSVFLPFGSITSGGSLTSSIIYENDTATLKIFTFNVRTSQGINIELFDTQEIKENTDYLLQNDKFWIEYNQGSDLGNFCRYDNISSGFLRIINFDKSKGILAGTFQFTSESSQANCKEIKLITEGRFDLNIELYYKN